jgi:hypothetical protein
MHDVSEASVNRTDDPGEGAGRRRRSPVGSRVLIAAGAALVVFAGVAAFVWTRDSGNSNGSTTIPTTAATVPGVKAEIVSLAKLRAIAATSGRSIYWAGPRRGTKLEYTQKTDGTTYVRYLTGSAKAGAPGANYVVIATYAQPDAYDAVKRSAEQEHLFIAQLSGGALAVTRPNRPQNIYVVHRDRPYQVEVYTPKPRETRRLVFGGTIQPVH